MANLSVSLGSIAGGGSDPKGGGEAFTISSGYELGSGGYGRVVTATENATGQKVAAKIIPLTRMRRSAVEKEIRLMNMFKGYPYIVGLRGVQETAREYIIYMDLAAGGELFNRVISSGSLQEYEAQPFFRQLLLAVQHMHSLGVVHRDLKLENVLLDEGMNCKVCDFGLAHIFERDADGAITLAKLKEVCGSKSYCAPEVLVGRGYDGFPTDVWSCGICLFAMLAGFFPLDEATGSDWRFEQVRMQQGKSSTCHVIYGFYDRQCDLSKDVTDLIDGMLAIDVNARLTVDHILASPWINKGAPPGIGAGGPTYRGMGVDPNMDHAALQALLAEDAMTGDRPVYRGGFSGKNGPPPGLCKQEAMFCADFHLEV